MMETENLCKKYIKIYNQHEKDHVVWLKLYCDGMFIDVEFKKNHYDYSNPHHSIANWLTKMHYSSFWLSKFHDFLGNHFDEISSAIKNDYNVRQTNENLFPSNKKINYIQQEDHSSTSYNVVEAILTTSINFNILFKIINGYCAYLINNHKFKVQIINRQLNILTFKLESEVPKEWAKDMILELNDGKCLGKVKILKIRS